MTLSLTLLTACSNKTSSITHRYETYTPDKSIVIDVSRYKCSDDEYKPVKFTKCQKDKYCLDEINAYNLYSNVQEMKSCIKRYENFMNHICEQDNIKCIGSQTK